MTLVPRRDPAAQQAILALALAGKVRLIWNSLMWVIEIKDMK